MDEFKCSDERITVYLDYLKSVSEAGESSSAFAKVLQTLLVAILSKDYDRTALIEAVSDILPDTVVIAMLENCYANGMADLLGEATFMTVRGNAKSEEFIQAIKDGLTDALSGAGDSQVKIVVRTFNEVLH